MKSVLSPRSFRSRESRRPSQDGTSLNSAAESNYGQDGEQFGLFRLDKNDTASDSRPIDDATRTYNADIIAIHGLGGTAFKTWAHSNGRLWLRDFVPNEFPGVRVYTFGYDSGFALSKGTGTLRDFATSLLQAINMVRDSIHEQRPIIFVCHSMGGIVAKLATIMAKEDPRQFPGIGKDVTGIIFLGTPHQGSPYATYASIMAQTANSFIIGSQVSRLTGKMRPDILNALKRQAPELTTIANDFKKYAPEIQIKSFVEGKKTQGLNRRVVDEQSALLGATNERTIPMVGYDHKAICRHGSASDNGLKLILFEIKDILRRNAVENISAKCSYIPFERNPEFVGQTEILNDLLSRFDHRPMDREVALYGLGGIGKSQIAIQHAYDFRERFPDRLVFWVYGGSKERLEQDYTEIAKRLELPGFAAPDVDILTLVKTSLEKMKNWMMIVDNMDDLFMFDEADSGSENRGKDICHIKEQYIPGGREGSILYTSRTKEDALQLTNDGSTVHVREMDDEDLKTLLRTKLRDATFKEEDLVSLIHALDRLPLAIVQAASLIRHKSWSIPQYLSNLSNEGWDYPSFGPLLHDFKDKTRDRTAANSVFKTWMITVRQLEEHEPQAAEILWLMSFCDRQHIPHYLLSGPDSSSLPSIREKRYSLAMSIATLVSYSFITVSWSHEGESYILHRLVQMFSLYWLERNGRAEEMATKALLALFRVFPMVDYENWTRSAELIPHVQAIVVRNMITSLPPYEIGVLLTAASTYLRMRAQLPKAMQYINLALEIVSAKLGEEDPTTIDDVLCCLARYHQDSKQYEKAETMLRTAINSYTTAFGSKHEKACRAKIFLSNVLRVQRKHPEAEKIARFSVDILKSEDSEESQRSLLLGKISLAKILGDVGKFDEALSMQRELIRHLQSQFGAEHPQSLNVLHDLAATLAMDNQLSEAKTVSLQVLTLSKKVHGPDHPRTANILYNLGRILVKQGELQEGERLFCNALKIFQAYSGPSLSETLNCLQHLGMTLERQNRYAEALEYFNRAYETLRSMFGATDKGTMLVQTDLQRVRRLMGQTYAIPNIYAQPYDGYPPPPLQDSYYISSADMVCDLPRPGGRIPVTLEPGSAPRTTQSYTNTQFFSTL